MTDELKRCPLLIGYDEHQGALIGSGMYRTPFMCQCIKDKCAAYDNGNCKQFNQNVLKEDKHDNG